MLTTLKLYACLCRQNLQNQTQKYFQTEVRAWIFKLSQIGKKNDSFVLKKKFYHIKEFTFHILRTFMNKFR